MRSYLQYCGLAKALDVVGDRWTLLIVRELLAGPRRYRDLLDGLPGIATNLLAQRLRQLGSAGVVEHDETHYRLTEWGQGLAEPIYALGRWAAPLMTEIAEGDTFRADWLVHPVRALFGRPDPRRQAVTVEVRVDGSPMTLECIGGEVHVCPGATPEPDMIITGRPDAIVGLLAGRLDPPAAQARGAHIVGDPHLLSRLRPDHPEPSGAIYGG